ncbi:hypothetical protein ACIPUD_39110 [Bradyrhizobium sp. CAR08]
MKDKLVEHWGVPDCFALLHQVGAVPPASKAMICLEQRAIKLKQLRGSEFRCCEGFRMPAL